MYKTWSSGFPWLFAGYAFTERLLDYYAPLFGVYAVSFVVIVLACALVEILNRRWFWAVPSALLVLGDHVMMDMELRNYTALDMEKMTIKLYLNPTL